MSRAKRRAHLQPAHRTPAPKPEPKAAPVLVSDNSIPEVDDLDCVFQTRWRDLLPKWADLTKEEQAMRGPFCDALSALFFSGGKLADHGITVKAGFDTAKIYRYIRATLGDFGPSHEHKIGGIAHMLAKWCDYHPKKK